MRGCPSAERGLATSATVESAGRSEDSLRRYKFCPNNGFSRVLRIEVRPKKKAASDFRSDKSPVFVGRDGTMDLVLDDPLVSRQHAVIISRGEQYVLQDIGARNPIQVNRREVLSHVLREGDIISVGDTDLVFSGSIPEDGDVAIDTAPTVVDARETIALLQHSEFWNRPVDDDTVLPTVTQSPAMRSDMRSERNLRILKNFSELIRNLSDRQNLLRAALDTVFDNLAVIRAFVGFFTPDGQLDIQEERNRGEVRRGRSYSRTIVDRVRRDSVAILFCPATEEARALRQEQKAERIAAEASMDQNVGGKAADVVKRRASGHGDALGRSRLARIDSKSIVRLKIKSAMSLPLFRGDKVIGVLYLDNRESSESFCQEDLYFASVLSHLISLAIGKEDLYHQIQDENIELKTILQQKNRMIAVSGSSQELLRKIKKVSSFDTTVLINGESGTGKELVARALHDRSPRRGKPFVAMNCAAIPETLLESELFGYAPKSGISGGNPHGKPGKFELAHGGTLFLDEIGDMSLATQAKILRVLEERVVDRLGGQEVIPVDLRIVAATNKVLADAVATNEFREDLYYRLKVFTIQLASLRERREDILPLMQHFLALHAPTGRAPAELSPRAKELLLAYHWPGNVRELKNCAEEALLLSNGRVIYPENLPSELRRDDNPQPFVSLADMEAQHIARVLQSVNWNKRRAAQILGINRSTLYEKLRVYGIERSVERPLQRSSTELQ